MTSWSCSDAIRWPRRLPLCPTEVEMVLVHDIEETAPSPPMSEFMTREEMESRFPDEWIFVIDPESDRHHRVLRGTVVCHSKDSNEVDRVAMALRPKRSAMFFTEVTPSDEILVPYPLVFPSEESLSENAEMSELMTREEIEARFPDEWIFVVDPENDSHNILIRGVVRCHSKDRDKVDRFALGMSPRPKRSAFLFTGTVPDDEVVAL